MFAFEPLEETVLLDVDVHMVAAAQERAARATRSPLQDAVFGTGRRSRVPRKGLRKDPRTAKTASSDTSLGLITPSLNLLARVGDFARFPFTLKRARAVKVIRCKTAVEIDNLAAKDSVESMYGLERFNTNSNSQAQL